MTIFSNAQSQLFAAALAILTSSVFIAASVALPFLELTGTASAQEAPKFVVSKVAERNLASLPPGDIKVVVNVAKLIARC